MLVDDLLPSRLTHSWLFWFYVSSRFLTAESIISLVSVVIAATIKKLIDIKPVAAIPMAVKLFISRFP